MITMIDYAVAKPFIEGWHYSGNVPKGLNYFFGWYLDKGLYAVANYGDGVNPYQAAFLKEKTGAAIDASNLLELKRLCRIEPKRPKTFLTQFIAGCHKQLKALGYRFVVSFSDPEHGHTGGIYKAANFKHLGSTRAEMHVIDREGNIHHRRIAYRYARQNNCSIEKAREVLGLFPHRTLPKDRWFYTL